MEKIKVAIIGVGTIAEEHIRSYTRNPNVELYALCDINAKRLREVGEHLGIPDERCFADYKDMLKLAEIDAVSVCVWNSNHASCTIAALEAGKHVLCEKPMSVTVSEAEAMKTAADQAGKLLMIGFVRRYGNDCAVLKDFIEKDFFGDIYYVKATYLRRNGNPGGWFGDKSRSGGGPLIDLGVHVIDLTRYLMGNPKPVSVYGATFRKLYDRKNIKGGKAYVSSSAGPDDICDVEDLASAMIRYENGAVLSIEAAFSLNIKRDEGKIELFGTKGGAKIEPEVEMFTEMNDYMADVNLAHPTALSFNGLFENEINHFVDCVINGTPCRSPAEDGIEIMKILNAVYKSAETGHEVVI